jgi:hypothetical protein
MNKKKSNYHMHRKRHYGMKPRESFKMHPSDLLEEALNLLGIPWENA